VKQSSKFGTLLLVLSWAAACGDDDDSGGDTVADDGGAQAARTDASSVVDAATPTGADAALADASPLSDAAADASGPVSAAELARALAREGIQVDQRRQQIVFDAWCKNEISCGFRDPSEMTACVEEQSQSFGFTLIADADCVDATLDQLACEPRLGCGGGDECIEALPDTIMACDELFKVPTEP